MMSVNVSLLIIFASFFSFLIQFVTFWKLVTRARPSRPAHTHSFTKRWQKVNILTHQKPALQHEHINLASRRPAQSIVNRSIWLAYKSSPVSDCFDNAWTLFSLPKQTNKLDYIKSKYAFSTEKSKNASNDTRRPFRVIKMSRRRLQEMDNVAQFDGLICSDTQQ